MKPAALLLPGHMCDSRMWTQTAIALASAGVPSTCTGLSRSKSIETMAIDALAVAPQQIIAVGFSMGGIVAMAMQRMAPERVVGLVLVDSNPAADLPERSGDRIAQQAVVQAGGLRRVLANDLKPNYLGAYNRRRKDLLDLIMLMGLAAGPDVFVRESEALRLRPDARAALASIACPTLVIGGAEDPLCPPDWQRALASAISGAELHLLECSGHFVPLEVPEAFHAALINWLGHHFPTPENNPCSAVPIVF